jgi:hypothetical protein
MSRNQERLVARLSDGPNHGDHRANANASQIFDVQFPYHNEIWLAVGQRSALARRSSAQGHSRRFRDVGGMSALPPKLTVTADIEGPAARVHGVSHWLMLWITRLWLRASESTRQTDTRLTQPSTQLIS